MLTSGAFHHFTSTTMNVFLPWFVSVLLGQQRRSYSIWQVALISLRNPRRLQILRGKHDRNDTVQHPLKDRNEKGPPQERWQRNIFCSWSKCFWKTKPWPIPCSHNSTPMVQVVQVVVLTLSKIARRQKCVKPTKETC